MFVKGKVIIEMSEEDMWRVVEKYFKDGVDYMIIYVGVIKEVVEKMKRIKRVVGMVLCGGMFLVVWIFYWGEENLFYKDYDYFFELVREYDVVLSFGDGFRFGGFFDVGDEF